MMRDVAPTERRGETRETVYARVAENSYGGWVQRVELDTEAIVDRVGFHAANPEAARLKADVLALCREVDRLRAGVTQAKAALAYVAERGDAITGDRLAEYAADALDALARLTGSAEEEGQP